MNDWTAGSFGFPSWVPACSAVHSTHQPVLVGFGMGRQQGGNPEGAGPHELGGVPPEGDGGTVGRGMGGGAAGGGAAGGGVGAGAGAGAVPPGAHSFGTGAFVPAEFHTARPLSS